MTWTRPARSPGSVHRRRSLRAICCSLVLAVAAVAQGGIRIARVPEAVVLPAAAGSNLLLEVELTAAPDEIWLAIDAVATDRVALQPVGPLRYQVNLADPRVQALLPSGHDQGELFVFALAGRQPLQSAPVHWSLGAPRTVPLLCIVRRKDGGTKAHAPEQRAWLDPLAVASIELQGAGSRQSAVVARLADVQVPLRRDADRQLWVFDDLALVRDRAVEGAVLEFEAQQGAAARIFRFELVPARLAVAPASFTIYQRHALAVPGTGSWLTVHIDDITMGQVELDITDAEGRVVVAPRSVSMRDEVEFALPGERCVLTVDRLVNFLFAEDYAVCSVHRAAERRPDPIRLLLDAVGRSEDLFVREGQEYPGPLARQFLVARLCDLPADLGVDAFIDDASKSRRTGTAYEVRRTDGSVVTMREWLRAESARIAAQTPKDR